MSEMTKAHWRQFIKQWRRAGAELARLHRRKIPARPFDAEAVDDLLQIGDQVGQSRKSSGLVELQRWLQRLAQAPAPGIVHEERASYETDPE